MGQSIVTAPFSLFRQSAPQGRGRRLIRLPAEWGTKSTTPALSMIPAFQPGWPPDCLKACAMQVNPSNRKQPEPGDSHCDSVLTLVGQYDQQFMAQPGAIADNLSHSVTLVNHTALAARETGIRPRVQDGHRIDPDTSHAEGAADRGI